MSPPFSPSSTTPVLEKDDADLDFAGNIDVNDDLPTEQVLRRVGDLLILDAKGQSRPFKDLYQGEGVAPRQLVIFIRHFFCGVSIPLFLRSNTTALLTRYPIRTAKNTSARSPPPSPPNRSSLSTHPPS